MNKQLEVPKGKDIVSMSLSGHTFVRLLDAKGEEIFRSASPAQDVVAVVQPGTYTAETDGKLGKMEFSSLGPRAPSKVDATQPPMPRE
jgi:hypothetical protein